MPVLVRPLRSTAQMLAFMASAVALSCAGSSAPSAPPAAATAAPPTSPTSRALLARIDGVVRTAMREQHLAGLSIAVARGDEVLVAKGYGFADLATRAPSGPDTVYRIGSVTKQFTAVLVLQLVDEGKVRLDDPITRYLPDYPTHGRTITVEHLLGHTSGIPSYTARSDWREKSTQAMTRAELVKLFSEERLEFEPGTRFSYSNSGYYLLGLIVEKVTGRPYAEIVQHRLLEPAGMKASGYCSDSLPNRAEGYQARAGRPAPATSLDMAHPYAAGALCSTVRDLLAWQRALDRGLLLSPAMSARMRSPGQLVDGTSTGYALGLFVGDLDDHRRVGHGGGINGFTSQLSRYPDDDLTVVVLTNCGNCDPTTVEQGIARVVLGIPEPKTKDIALPEEERGRYLGRYALAPGLVLRVFEEGARLRVQGTGQPAVTLLFQGDHTFVLEPDPSVKLVFRQGGPRSAALSLYQGGMKLEAPRLPDDAPAAAR